MRTLLIMSALVLLHSVSLACEVCQKQQPKVLRGITHGVGPQSDWDYVAVGITALVMVVSLFYSIKWIIHPDEKEKGHIKNSIFYFE